jgi:hypothetical protein
VQCRMSVKGQCSDCDGLWDSTQGDDSSVVVVAQSRTTRFEGMLRLHVVYIIYIGCMPDC